MTELAELDVRLIAFTFVRYLELENLGLGFGSNLVASSSDVLAEFAGRACYQSWEKPNPETATNEGYLNNIIRQQHFSVCEHASATFYITGVSRSFTHELVRHRHLSFSQVSQRYVDESQGKFVVPPGASEDEIEVLRELHARARWAYNQILWIREKDGANRKEARQAARSVLPNAHETKIVVTGNLRAWREVIQKRYSAAADKEFYVVAERILKHLKDRAPNTFQDLELNE